jgi:hypothetical protein
MMLSVLKNTDRPVKFWFIKNYLSPKFKVRTFLLIFKVPLTNDENHSNFESCSMTFVSLRKNIVLFYLAVDHFLIVKGRGAELQGVIPHMAREYGFEYDLVTYKWPSWLHKQTEKQRIILVYKIWYINDCWADFFVEPAYLRISQDCFGALISALLNSLL